MNRCAWAKTPSEEVYHDQKWGVALHNERELFKMLLLEGQQAGLSWRTILNKMPAFDVAYDQFDPQKIATYDQEKVLELMGNDKVIRNRLKIQAAITNAQAYLKLVEEFGSLDHYLWKFVNFSPIINQVQDFHQVPTSTPLSDEISSDLKARGFKFVGTTIIYAYLQAIGIVNDHQINCDFR